MRPSYSGSETCRACCHLRSRQHTLVRAQCVPDSGRHRLQYWGGAAFADCYLNPLAPSWAAEHGSQAWPLVAQPVVLVPWPSLER